MVGLRLNVSESVMLGDKRPVPGQPTVKDFVEELQRFLTEMQERCPDAKHPTMEWLEYGFSMIALSQHQSDTMSPEPVNLVETVSQAVRHKMLAQVQRSLEEGSSHLTAKDAVFRHHQAS